MKTLTPRTVVCAVAAAVLGSMLAAAGSSIAKDDDKGHKGNDFSARLSGFNEVHFNAGPPATLRGAVSTKASGSFKLKIDEALGLINYELAYQDLTPGGTVTQAHIHFGQRHTAGGITVWLCQTAGTPAPAEVAAATPVCPAAGTIAGTILPAQVLAPAGQGFSATAPERFDELIRAIRSGTTYANVHSTTFPPGEIRGQIRHGGGHGKGK